MDKASTKEKEKKEKQDKLESQTNSDFQAKKSGTSPSG